MIRHPIHIPKTGTWSVKKAMQLCGIDLLLNGHMSAEEMRAKIQPPVQLGATVRNPEERLVSMMNHLWGGNPLVSLEEGFKQVIEANGFHGQVFRTTRWHIDPQTVLFPFEGLPIIEWLGCNVKTPHDNESKHRWTVKELRGHEMWEEAMAPYEGDWALYDFARKNVGCSIADLIA